MPEIGDVVLYGTSGACRVDSISQTEYGEYYILVPLFMSRTRISVPRKNAELVAKMRPIPGRAETRARIRKALAMRMPWIEDDNTRKMEAKRIIAADDDIELIGLIQCFYIHKQKTLEAGRKFHVADENILQSAQVKLHNEYAVIFDIAPDEVPSLIAEIAR